MSDPKSNPAAVIKATEHGMTQFVPYGAQDAIKLSVSIVQNLIAVPTKSGKTCSPKEALKFIAMCQAKRINPFEGDCFLIGYDGTDGPTFALVTAHQTYLKRAELHPEFDGMKSGIIVLEGEGEEAHTNELEGDFYLPNQKVVGGWARVFFKNRKEPMYKRLRLVRFQKSFGVWRDDAAGMICKCAEADALRSSFPTMLGGLYLREEIEAPTPPPMTKPDFGASRPLFSDPRTVESLPAEPGVKYPTMVEPDPNDAPPGAEMPPVEQPPAAKKIEPVTPLTQLRKHCAMARIKEGDLIMFLADTGSTDGSASTLEELSVSFPEVVSMVLAQWPDISGRIKASSQEAK